MISPSNAQELHRDAMDRMDEHDALVRSGKKVDARLVALDALQIERRALRCELNEPFRSLVYRSAAAIALDAGLPSDALALIGEALAADDVPDLLANQLRQIARDARRRLQSPTGDTTWHRLRIFKTKSSEVEMEAVSRAMQAWLKYLEVGVAGRIRRDEESRRTPRLHFQPAAVIEGSFVAGMNVVAEANDLQLLTRMFIDLREAIHLRKMPPLSEIRAWLDVLDTLEYGEVGLEVVLIPSAGESITLAVDADAIAIQRDLVRKASLDKLFSSEVPQADDLLTVFALVKRIKQSGRRPEPTEFGFSPRQLNYYRHAAEVLRFLSMEQPWQLGAAGERIATLDEPQQLACTAVEFETTRVGRAWIEWSQAKTLVDIDPQSANEFVTQCVVDLSESTVERRARTLSAWIRALAPHHYAAR